MSLSIPAKCLFASLVATSVLASGANAAQSKKVDKRWFEIEVILFSQIDDKSKLKEQFDEGATLPKRSRVVDMLNRYLYPQLADLKQQLPSCQQSETVKSYVEQAALWPEFYSEKTLDEIDLSIESQLVTTDSISAESSLPNESHSF